MFKSHTRTVESDDPETMMSSKMKTGQYFTSTIPSQSENDLAKFLYHIEGTRLSILLKDKSRVVIIVNYSRDYTVVNGV